MHSAFGFAHLWQQEEFAAVDLLLTAAAVDTAVADAQQHTVLMVPGHKAILSNSDYIRAQVLRWQTDSCSTVIASNQLQEQHPSAAAGSRQTLSTSKDSSSSSSSDAVDPPATPDQLVATHGQGVQCPQGEGSCAPSATAEGSTGATSSSMKSSTCQDAAPSSAAASVDANSASSSAAGTSSSPSSSSDGESGAQDATPADASCGLCPAATTTTTSSSGISSTGSRRPQVVLTLQDASHVPAALAVLSALYSVKPLPELLSELPQEQQLHAALLADMWQIPQVSTAAVELLVQAASNKGKDGTAVGLEAAANRQFLQLQAYPACLLPLFSAVVAAATAAKDWDTAAAAAAAAGGEAGAEAEAAEATAAAERKAGTKCLLLSVLGDLEEVWADAALQEVLLGLPLPAMELLLSCDELKAASEDTVLYTAQLYADQLKLIHLLDADAKLARQIRCPHLSQYWLGASLLSDEASSRLLTELKPQLKQLMMARLADPSGAIVMDDLRKKLPEVPASWFCPQRPSSKQDLSGGVQLQWVVPVADIKQASQDSFSERQVLDLWVSQEDSTTGWP